MSALTPSEATLLTAVLLTAMAAIAAIWAICSIDASDKVFRRIVNSAGTFMTAAIIALVVSFFMPGGGL